jgi:hypothetical protein
VTLQEVFERDGFIVINATVRRNAGDVVILSELGQGAGSAVVITEETTQEDSERQANMAGFNWPPSYGFTPYYYKAIAE